MSLDCSLPTDYAIHYEVRDLVTSDIPRAHEFIVALAQLHSDQDGNQETSHLSLDTFGALIHRNYIKGLVLVIVDKEAEVSVIGCMLYVSNICPTRQHSGIYLEHFYVLSEYRGKGLGHMMMEALCRRVLASGGKYIKLYYQHNESLSHLYGRMGFVNQTRNPPRMHLCEIFGPEEVKQFCDKKVDQPADAQPRICTLPFTDQVSGDIPTLNVSKESPTSPQLVMVSQSGNRTSSALCTFTEQPSICTWEGPFLNVSDILGDLRLLTPRLLQDRVGSWLERMPELRGVEWEVPGDAIGEADPRDCVVREQNPLLHALAILGVLDTTIAEQYEIAILDENGMKTLCNRDHRL